MTRRFSGRTLCAVLATGVLGCLLFSTATAGAATLEIQRLGAISAEKAAKKKKCKKKGKKGSVAAKKKCKKKKKPAPPFTSRERANLTFSAANAQVDLHAYDSTGTHTGWRVTGPGTGQVINGIPSAIHSGDVVGPGSERFTDNAFLLSGANREFSYLLCFYDGSPNAPLSVTTASGQVLTDTVPGVAATSYSITYPGSPPVPASASCPVA
jgi:hypothetical protein